jgi:hypothetical protein
MISVEIPMPVPSLANMRGHWSKKARIVKRQRAVVAMALRAKAFWNVNCRCRVTLVRVAPRQLDGDNCIASMKAIQDGVADWLGVDDRSPVVAWAYQQERGRPKYQAVRILVEAA